LFINGISLISLTLINSITTTTNDSTWTNQSNISISYIILSHVIWKWYMSNSNILCSLFHIPTLNWLIVNLITNSRGFMGSIDILHSLSNVIPSYNLVIYQSFLKEILTLYLQLYSWWSGWVHSLSLSTLDYSMDRSHFYIQSLF